MQDVSSVLDDVIASLERCNLLAFPPDVIVAAVLTSMPKVFHDAPADAVQDFADLLGRALRRRTNVQPVDVHVILN